MNKILIILFLMFSLSANAQIVVTEFNAEWNAVNGVEWLGKLSDCDIAKVDIMKQAELQKKALINMFQIFSKQRPFFSFDFIRKVYLLFFQ